MKMQIRAAVSSAAGAGEEERREGEADQDRQQSAPRITLCGRSPERRRRTMSDLVQVRAGEDGGAAPGPRESGDLPGIFAD
jgi:hypothetical protein